jgi:hypothetical protein
MDKDQPRSKDSFLKKAMNMLAVLIVGFSAGLAYYRHQLQNVPTDRPPEKQTKSGNIQTTESVPGSPAASTTGATPPASTTVATPPDVLNFPTNPPQINLMVRADWEAHLGEGCKQGLLLLSRTGLDFTCPTESKKNLTIGLSEITAVDSNGVKTVKKPYHFIIQHASKEQSAIYFQEWLRLARASAE